jgi:hypothetical protein
VRAGAFCRCSAEAGIANATSPAVRAMSRNGQRRKNNH